MCQAEIPFFFDLARALIVPAGRPLSDWLLAETPGQSVKILYENFGMY
jgi:hypothetical protein